MRSETSFDLDGDLILVDAVVVGPSGRAKVQLVLDTCGVLTTLVPSVAQAAVHVNVADLGYGVDGVLGMNFLLDYNIEIRPAARRIVVERITP